MTAGARTSVPPNGVTLGFLASAALVVWILAGLGGWSYYTTPLAVRAYEDSHRLLRPSGPIGQSLGLVGAAMMLVPFAYMIRKRLRRGSGAGLRVWLEVHLFCGIVGPVLVTFHTTFKFNGIVSAAYWSMVIVMLSGFAGRYLYLQIPRSLRGAELTRAELDARAAELHDDLANRAGAAGLVARIDRLCARAVPPQGRPASWSGLLFGEFGLRRAIHEFRSDVDRTRLPQSERDVLVRLTTERVLLLRRTAYLTRTKSAFALWHVFNLPLVYMLLAIVVLHVGVVTYLGYVPFRW